MSVEQKEVFRIRKTNSSLNLIDEERTSSSEKFSSIDSAESEYRTKLSRLKKEIRIEEIQESLVLFGGFIAGVGLSAIAHSDLSPTSDRTYLGASLLIIGAAMAKRGFDALDREYDLKGIYNKTKEKLFFVKDWAVKQVEVKKIPVEEVIVTGEPVPQGRVVEEVTPASSPSEIAKEEERKKDEEEKAKASPKLSEPSKEEKAKEVKEAPSGEKINIQLTLDEELKKSKDEARDEFKGPDVEKMLKHYEWRDKVIREERKFLKEVGIIPDHQCRGLYCEKCKEYDPIFV